MQFSIRWVGEERREVAWRAEARRQRRAIGNRFVFGALVLLALGGCGHTTQPLPRLKPAGMPASIQPVGQRLAQARRMEIRGQDKKALGTVLLALKQLELAEESGDKREQVSRNSAELHATAALMRLGRRQGWRWLRREGLEVKLPDGSLLRVRHDFEEADPVTLDPRQWPDIDLAAQIPTNQLKNRVTLQGHGIPMVLSRPVDVRTGLVLWPDLERELEVVPATLLTSVEDGEDGAATLHLRWQNTRQSVEWDGGDGRRAVAADFSAPLEVFGAAGGFRAPALLGILRPDRFPESIELFRMSPADDDRIPVVLVHGLGSQPRGWRGVVNEMMRDRRIRENCQFYYFAYPTSQPLPFAASELRRNLAELEAAGLAEDGEVLMFGHSLGGLVSRLQTVETGEALWDVYFRASPEDLEGVGPVTRRVADWLVVQPAPQVGRVVFVCTPHGGSEIADSWIGAIGRRLARVPRDILTTASTLAMLDVGVLTDEGRRVTDDFPTVVQTLSVESEFLQALRPLPLAGGIAGHTIYGNKHMGRPERRCTDGVVSCESARLPGMASELMVNSGHGAHKNREAIAEMARIVRLHLDRVDSD